MIEASVSYEKGEARIKYDNQKITVAKLREVINGTGFQAVEESTTAKTFGRDNTKADERTNDERFPARTIDSIHHLAQDSVDGKNNQKGYFLQ